MYSLTQKVGTALVPGCKDRHARLEKIIVVCRRDIAYNNNVADASRMLHDDCWIPIYVRRNTHESNTHLVALSQNKYTLRCCAEIRSLGKTTNSVTSTAPIKNIVGMRMAFTVESDVSSCLKIAYTQYRMMLCMPKRLLIALNLQQSSPTNFAHA